MQGLTSEQVRDLFEKGYSNVQIDKSQKTTKDILKENIFTYFNLIFLIMAILVIAAGSYRSLTFMPVVIANMLIGIIQELRAKKILDRLSVMNEPNVCVIRDGTEKIVRTQNVVLGDIIVLRAGNQICADAVVVSGEVAVNEALLTGEADEIDKKSGDRLMSGSFVVSGECYAKLTSVGRDSYISRLTLKAKKVSHSEQSEMVRSIDRLVICAGILVIPVGILLFSQGMIHGGSFSDSVVSMVAAVTGMIPEGLYLLVSVALAMSTIRLAQNKIMLHDMKSIETLARVDVLCVDKTGTITDNSMLVEKVLPADSHSGEEEYRKLCTMVGDYIGVLPDSNATMKAFEDFFVTGGGKKCLSYLPFSSRYKYSSVQFSDATYIMGAPDILLRKNLEKWEELIGKYAGKGLRVVVFGKYSDGNTEQASCPVPKNGIEDGNVEPLLFILLQNTIRENAAQTFEYFEKQGVDIKVISGDNAMTVSEVARTAGIRNSDKFIDASVLKNDDEIDAAVKKYSIFGRVTPEQKQRIVRALKKNGHTVAMTGDGVNDILAMKDADCSIAMAAGSDAAIQAAQVVLLDSDFSRMPGIVAEGRRDINNIERSATLFIVKNIFSLLLAVFSIINLWQYPLLPSQVSLISMFNIGIPAFFLAMEPNNKRIKGNFMVKVLMNAMPAALTDFFAIAALVIFGDTFGVSQNDISVAATFLLAIVGFMILTRISSPVNRYRVTVIVGSICGMVFCARFMNDLFAITYVSVECIMLFILFAIATEPCMRYLTAFFEFLQKKVQRKLLKHFEGEYTHKMKQNHRDS